MDKETRGTQTDEVPSSSTTFRETSTSPMSSRTSSAKYKAKLAELDNLTGHIIIHKFFTKEDVDLESFIKELTKREPMAKIFNSTLNSVVFSKNGSSQEIQEIKKSIDIKEQDQTAEEDQEEKSEENIQLCEKVTENSSDRNVVKDELGEIEIKSEIVTHLKTSLSSVESCELAQTSQENLPASSANEEKKSEIIGEITKEVKLTSSENEEIKTENIKKPELQIESSENNEDKGDDKKRLEERKLGVGKDTVGKSSESREIAEELVLKIEEEILISPQNSILLLENPSPKSQTSEIDVTTKETHQAHSSVHTEEKTEPVVDENDQNADKSQSSLNPSIQLPKFSYEYADGNKSGHEAPAELTIKIVNPSLDDNEPYREAKTQNGEDAAKCPLLNSSSSNSNNDKAQLNNNDNSAEIPSSNPFDADEETKRIEVIENFKKLERSPSFDSGFNTNTVTDSPETSSTFTPTKTNGKNNLLLPPSEPFFENGVSVTLSSPMLKEEEMAILCAEVEEAMIVPILRGDSTDNLVAFCKSDDESSIAVDENYDARSESSNVSIQSSRNSHLRNISVQTKKKGMRGGGLMSGSSTASSSAQLIDLEVVSKRSSVIGSSSRRLYLPSSSSSLNVLNLDLSLSSVDELKLNVKMSPGRERKRISIKGPQNHKEIEGKTEKVKRSLERLEKVVK